MGFSKAKVVLDHPDRNYNAGQQINGSLDFRQGSNKTVVCIYLMAKGWCQTRWWSTQESRELWNYERQNVQKKHEAKEIYIDCKIYLLGARTGTCTLQAGQQSMPFTVKIPSNCPSSFEGRHGCIRYLLRFVMQLGSCACDKQINLKLHVTNPFDLNEYPSANEPLSFQFEERLWFCGCSSGSYNLTVRAPLSGYCVGEHIPIELECRNESSVKIKQVVFEVRKQIEFRSQNDKTLDYGKLVRVKKGPIPKKDTTSMRFNIALPPDLPLPNLTSCKWIGIQYLLWVMVVPSGCHHERKQTRRIYLGHVPLVERDEPGVIMTPSQEAKLPAREELEEN